MNGDLVLYAFAAAVVVFALVSWARLLWLLHLDAIERKALDEWWESRRQRREDPSSLLDDSPQGPLPETFRAPCGEPLRFPSQNDRGNAA